MKQHVADGQQSMGNLIIEANGSSALQQRAREFWTQFKSDNGRPKFVFGCNVYSKGILAECRIDGFIDDYSNERTFSGRPIIRSADLPDNAMVLAAAGGRPLSVRHMLDERNVDHLDYFSIMKWSGANLAEAVFNEGFSQEFAANQTQFQWVHDRFADALSREIFRKLISFRLNYDLDVLQGFSDRQKEQYFEDFLNLRPAGEVFVDVGCYDGCTTLEFIKHCPDYAAVQIFEPDPANLEACQRNLQGRPNITISPVGASDEKKTLSFSTNGSASGVSQDGELKIDVDRIDSILEVPPTFIKMDIEGSEAAAIAGAANTISTHAPRLAISVYHKPDDLWRIPRQVLKLHADYEIYLRHYTESIYETVMFFVPRSATPDQ